MAVLNGKSGRGEASPCAGIGIIGGTGVYDPQLLEQARQVEIGTPFGSPSDKITLGVYEGKSVAILPRHGADHRFNPSLVNYRANIWALKSLGVARVLAPYAVGSLQEDIRPGDFVFVDQFLDRTQGRKQTFYDKPGKVCHISVADPACRDLRNILIESARGLDLRFRPGGTYVCIEGPRFSSRAESRFYRDMGGHVVGMTMVPECILAREAEMCYAGIAMVTDYDTFKEQAVSIEEVLARVKENMEKVRALLAEAIRRIPGERPCSCGSALKDAFI
jgi:5'-methylthioadenosine phosphorylase